MGIRVAHIINHIRECGDAGVAAEHGIGNGALARHLKRRPVIREVEEIEDEEETPQEVVVVVGHELLSLDRYQCHFPVTPHDTRAHRFCGDAVQPGSKYCEEHHKIAYMPVRPPAAKLNKRV